MALDKLATAIGSKKRTKFNPSVQVHVRTINGPSMPDDSSWRKDEYNRHKSDLDALQKELDNFDDMKAAKKVKMALHSKIKMKKVRMQECKLRMDNPDMDHDGY